MASVILEKCIFVIDTWIPLKKKVELIRAIKAHGGISVYSVTDKTTHLVTSQEGYNENSEKVLKAKELKVFVVSKEFVTDSVTAGQKLDESKFVLTTTAPPSQPAAPSPASSPATPTSSATPENPSIKASKSKPPLLSTNSTGHLAPFLSLSSSSGVIKPQKIKSPKRGGSFPRGALTVDTTKRESPRDGSDSSGSNSPTTPNPISPTASTSPSLPPPPSTTGKLSSSTSGDLEDDGCKIFVGGITMEDLDALKLTKDGESHSDEVAAHIQKLKSERLLEIIRILSRFGTVVRVKQFLEKKHIFITYNTREAAIAALKSLRSLDVRHKIIQEVKDGLRAEGRQSIVAPKPNFYVRWPHDVNSQGDGFPGKTQGAVEKAKNMQLSISSGEESDTGYTSSPAGSGVGGGHHNTGYWSETSSRMQNNFGYGFQNRYTGFRNPYPPIPITPPGAQPPTSAPFSSSSLPSSSSSSPSGSINATAANKTGFYRPASSYMNKPKNTFFQSESESESFQNSFSETEAASRSRQERSALNRSGGSSHPFAPSASSSSSSTTTAPSALIRMAPVLPPPSTTTSTTTPSSSTSSDNKDGETSEFKRRLVTGTDNKEDVTVSSNTNPNLAPFKTTPTDAGLHVTPAARKKSSSPMEVLLDQVRNNDSAIVVLLLLLVIFFLANVYFFLFAK